MSMVINMQFNNIELTELKKIATLLSAYYLGQCLLTNVKKLILAAFFSFFAIVMATLLINIGMIFAARRYVYSDISKLPPRTAILVLGSQTHGTRLSPVLQDRVDSAIRLMEKGIGKKLLLSGDHGQKFYDEATAMLLYVLTNAPFIQEEDIFVDYAGFSTWESMYRARNIFQVRDIIIVTQQFHISRAVNMARSLGMDAVGYGINQERFRGRSLRNWHLREYFARVKAFYSIVFRPKPTYLGEIIPISGDGRDSWI
jgi:SanA protein